MVQRFTQITQAMVDEAPPASATLPELADMLEGRVMVAHNASFDRRVLKQAFARSRVPWPDPPVICTAQPKWTTVLQNDLVGFVFNPINLGTYPFHNMSRKG